MKNYEKVELGDSLTSEEGEKLHAEAVGPSIVVCVNIKETSGGGMFHFYRRERQSDDLINYLKTFGSSDVEIKGYGGSKFFSDGNTFGEDIVSSMRKKIQNNGFEFDKADFGGSKGRSITFDTGNGDLKLHVNSQNFIVRK